MVHIFLWFAKFNRQKKDLVLLFGMSILLTIIFSLTICLCHNYDLFTLLYVYLLLIIYTYMYHIWLFDIKIERIFKFFVNNVAFILLLISFLICLDLYDGYIHNLVMYIVLLPSGLYTLFLLRCNINIYNSKIDIGKLMLLIYNNPWLIALFIVFFSLSFLFRYIFLGNLAFSVSLGYICLFYLIVFFMWLPCKFLFFLHRFNWTKVIKITNPSAKNLI